MATTTYQFAPSATAPFQFQPTFDSNVYTVIVTWSLFGVRYYINVYQLDGTLIVSRPLIGSPDDYNINLLGGYFTTQMVYRSSSNNFEVID